MELQQMPTDEPAFDELADNDDELDWDRDRDGLMADAATGVTEEPETSLWEVGN